ncbi:MAG: integrase [Parcubacteria group bacterium]|nr:integrase [Parcubacteria group bacterium]|tara:strand:+ start:11413 stop:12648 length:1236 start_codon:yes stop_codon:yes gene_type:complete
MINSELKRKIKSTKKPSRFRVDKNLYIRISKELTPFWVFLYRVGDQQKQLTIGRFGSSKDEVTLAEAKDKAADLRSKLKQGYDPAVELNLKRSRNIVFFDDLAQSWLENDVIKFENPQIPTRIYNNDIKPRVGKMHINKVSGFDINDTIQAVAKSGRPTIANKTLLHLKQIFAYGIRMGITNNNPASAFRNKHAGGPEKPRTRTLSLNEIKIIFDIFKMYKNHFTQENYIAVALLLILGVRKTELTQAKWKEFDLENQCWLLPESRSKTKEELLIPLPDQLMPWINTLKSLSKGSEYVFPTRRAGQRGHISDSTINSAISNILSKKMNIVNESEQKDIKHFVLHDLRRTCRTLLESLDVKERVAEKYLNHKLKGVLGVYNKHSYFEERKAACKVLTELLFPLIDNPSIYTR